MRCETVFGDTDFYRAFPDPKDVFANHVDKHADVLLPVGSLSLNHLSPSWHGLIHFILPVEPAGGCGFAGESANEFCNYLCRPNWIGYRLTDEKCELACDLRFFRKFLYADKPPRTAEEQEEAEELERHYLQTHDEFDRRSTFYCQQGWLCQWPDEWSGEKTDVPSTRRALIRDVGGVSWHGNWSNIGDFPLSRYPEKRNDHNTFKVYPRAESGRDFHFVGSVDMWDYLGHTNGRLLLFYDPEACTALSTIDWS